MKIRDRAARALDLTHRFADRGPRTHFARERLAERLDTNKPILKKDVLWLEHVIAEENDRSRNGTFWYDQGNILNRAVERLSFHIWPTMESFRQSALKAMRSELGIARMQKDNA